MPAAGLFRIACLMPALLFAPADAAWAQQGEALTTANEPLRPAVPATFDLADLSLAPLPAIGVAAAPVESTEPYGPADPEQPGTSDTHRYDSFGAQVGTVKWELAGVVAYLTAINIKKVIDEPAPFHFKKEGWFGDDTAFLGVDKLTHAFNAYVLTELIQARLEKKTNGAPGTQITAAVLASSLSLYTELYDAIAKDVGFSWEDVIFNTAGIAFSALRNSVPGLDEKLDYRMMIVPNSDIYSFHGGRHFQQLRFLFALKLAGFERFRATPLRYVELHAGYYATNITDEARARGLEREQRPFVGIGLNVGELLFGRPQSRLGRAGREVFNYLQLPYTALHVH